VRFTDERWEHIIRRHPTLVGERDRLIETLRRPDPVQRGDGSEMRAIRRHDHDPFDGTYLVVANIEEGASGGFIAAAYSARRLTTTGRTVWTR
jgi:hypothetical protein